MADTPTPPLPLGDVTALLEQAAESWSIDAETAILVGHRAGAVEEFHRRAAACRAAATTLEGLEAVMRDPVLDFALQYVSEERLIDLYSGLPPEGIHAAVFVRQRASELRSRLRAVVGTGTPEEESDG